MRNPNLTDLQGFALLTVGAIGISGCSEYDLTKQKEPNEEATTYSTETYETTTTETTTTPVTTPTGTVKTDTDAPVAVCDVAPNPVQPPFEKATWYGEESRDPLGEEIVAYNWSLISQPAGSAVAMRGGNDANRPDFSPDLAGDYVAELVVETADGRFSEPCETTLEAIPTENLWVEMYWTQSPDDMDLHLLAPGGVLETGSDCYYSNCVGRGLDWGTRNDTADDPSLDLDDIAGTGPENINISEPQDGVFTVIVHDYEGSNWPSNDVQGANDVTVNIYVNGALEWTDTRQISRDNTYTEFAEIDWTSGTVNGL